MRLKRLPRSGEDLISAHGPACVAAALAMLFCWLLLAPSPALAKEVHVFGGSFGSEGSGSGQFKEPHGVAVNDVTHEVYVADTANNRVQVFNASGSAVLGEFNGSAAPTGAFSGPTQIAVDNSGNPLDPSAGDVYVVDRGHNVVDKFTAGGTYLGQLSGTPSGVFVHEEIYGEETVGVAVDPSGGVWVLQNILFYVNPHALTGEGFINRFSDALANSYLSTRTTEFGPLREGLGVDSEDNIYGQPGDVAKFNSSGATLISQFGGTELAWGVAVDSTGGEVYVDNAGSIGAFSLGGAPIERFGSGHLSFSKGVAVDASNGWVYASDESADKVVIFEAFKLPSVSIGAPSAQQPRSVTLNGTVNPEGHPVTSCVFEYGSTSAYGQSVPCSPSPGSGSTPEAVSAHLTGLTPRSTYHYRLVAENAIHVSSATPDQELVAGPVLGGESVIDAASTSATMLASIDPNGADTHYYFQYGRTVAYGSDAPVPAPGVDLGSLRGAQNVSVHLQGLEAGAVYHYRLVAAQAGETFEQPDHTFTTQPASVATALPDGRMWELVSPASKNGALIEPLEAGGQIQAATDGGAITYLTQGPSAGENPAGKISYSQVLSRRGPAGWRTADLTLPGRLPENGEQAETIGGFDFEYRLFSPDLSLAAVEPQTGGTPPLAPGVSERTLYLRDDLAGSFLPLVTAANVPPGTRIEEPTFNGNAGVALGFEMHFLAATPDLSHVVFETPLALTPEAIDEETAQNRSLVRVQKNLYEWNGGKLQLVNILPNSEVAHGPAPAVPSVTLAGGFGFTGKPRGGVQRDVSSDGRRIAWAWGEPAEPAIFGGLFVRDMVDEKTVRVGGAGAVYQTMNSDGSKVFFLENGDLHVFGYGSATQSDLTGVHGSGEGSAGVQEVVSDVSEDGSYVYFVATGVLASGGVSGGNNLYVLHDTGNGWTTTFVATLSHQDKPSWYTEIFSAPFLARVSSRVSPGGRFLAFMSNRSLTGYDNIDAVSGQPDEEVYLYDAQAGRLVCASCDPTGARPVGVFDSERAPLVADRAGVWSGVDAGSDKRTDHWLAGSIPGWNDLNGGSATYQPRYLSDSGRLFFNSPVALVPQDTNGLEDVYQFEPVGVGGCVDGGATFSERSGGCVDLISSGTSSSESVFYDASENGNDVFFATTGRLLREDFDRAYDVYDAHVCTGVVPCRAAAVSPPACTSGDSCKAAPSPQPSVFGPPPSATFNGAGNVASLPAGAGAPPSSKDAQRRARALHACHKKHGRRRRACEAKARKRYPATRSLNARSNRKGNR